MFFVNILKVLFFFILFMIGFTLFKKMINAGGSADGKKRVKPGTRGPRGKDAHRDPGVIELDKNDYHVE